MTHQPQIQKLHRIVLNDEHGFEPDSLDYLPDFLEAVPDYLERLTVLTSLKEKDLDFSLASLESLEEWVLKKYPTQDDFKQPGEAEAVIALSCYIGETLRRAVPGSEWTVQAKPDVTGYGRPVVRTPDRRQFSPVGYTFASTCSWRRTGQYIREGVARRIELNSPSNDIVEDAVPANTAGSSSGVEFVIRAYDPSVRPEAESGVSIENIHAHEIPASARATFGSILTQYGYEAQRADSFSHEVLGTVVLAANVITFRIPYSDDYESAIMDASMAATEVARDVGLSVYFPFDNTWAEVE